MSPLRRAIPRDVRAVLEHPDRFEVIALDVDEETHEPGSGYYGHRELSRRLISDSQLQDTIRDALYDAVDHFSFDGMLCFEPRHAIHAVKGHRTVDLVILFRLRSRRPLFERRCRSRFVIRHSAGSERFV